MSAEQPSQNHPEAAFELPSDGIGRRDLLKATAAIGAGAVAPAWLASSGATPAVAAPRRRAQYRILQPGEGPTQGTYIRATPETVRWGRLPDRASKPIRTVRSGSVVTIDTVAHEGILEDQGRDPVKCFGSKGVPAREVLLDARAIADSDVEHDFANDGPHIIVGPVSVTGAEPGDVLRVDVLRLLPRVPYGVISNRHGKGALPGEYPEGPPPDPNASTEHPELYRNVSVFTPLRRIRGRDVLVLPVNAKLRAEFPFEPFLGTMGVARDTGEALNSVFPHDAGGNLDLNDLQVGSTLYLPVEVPGAKFFVGDPHFAQGDGEVALTAVEGSLRATLRLTLIKQGSKRIPSKRTTLTTPFAETPDYWIPIGLNEDLDEALKEAVREGDRLPARRVRHAEPSGVGLPERGDQLLRRGGGGQGQADPRPHRKGPLRSQAPEEKLGAPDRRARTTASRGRPGPRRAYGHSALPVSDAAGSWP